VTDAEILEWLVRENAIDWPVLSYHRIMQTDGLEEVADRLIGIGRALPAEEET
jgi:hypothetical protein